MLKNMPVVFPASAGLTLYVCADRYRHPLFPAPAGLIRRFLRGWEDSAFPAPAGLIRRPLAIFFSTLPARSGDASGVA